MWKTIFDEIVENIQNGVYKENTKLPSENKLAEEYNVTRHDVRKVYERLDEMGYIFSEQGKGRYFKSKNDKIKYKFRGKGGFTKKMKDACCTVETINIDFQEEQHAPKIRKKLQLEDKDKLYKVQKLRIINGEPSAIYISFVSNKMFPRIIEEGPHIKSIFEYFNEKGYKEIFHTNSNFQVMLPTNFERNILHCPNLVPVMVLERVCHCCQADQPIEFIRSIYRGDRFVFDMESDEKQTEVLV